MYKNKFVFAFVVCLSLIGSPALAAFSAHEVMTKNEEARKLSDVIAKAKLVTGGGGSTERTKEFTWWRKLADDKVNYSTLTRFHSPPEVKGQGILFIEKGDTADIQMYLPSFKKNRRVESQQQSGSFMGSEFSYSDITSPHVSDYKYTMIKEEETCAEGTASTKCFLIESTPATEPIKERTGTKRSRYWVRKDNFMAVKAEHYNLQDELWKKVEFTENKEVSTKDHKWMAHNVKVENAKNQRFTTLQFSDVKVSEKVPANTFTPQNLSREK